MPETLAEGAELSPWWRRGILFILLAEFSVLIWIAATTYVNVGPPIPERVTDQQGNTVFSGSDIIGGQQVFLKYALMNNGTIWGHGAYLGPDFSAEYLHRVALEATDALARREFNKSVGELNPAERSALTGRVYEFLARNRYDEASRTLVLTDPEALSFRKQIGEWQAYFSGSRESRGLPDKLIDNAEDLRQLTSYFAWAAWASAAHIPGENYSYTNNFPYDPAIGNGPSSQAILWSAFSLVALLAGTAVVLLAFGRFH